MHPMKTTFALVLLVFLLVGRTQGKSRFAMVGIQSDQEVYDFIDRLNKDFATGNRDDVAALVRFPTHAFVDGKRVSITGKKKFIDNYDQIINKKVVDAVRVQDPQKLFVNWQGVMVGHGELWINLVVKDKTLKITAINNI
jgi:hypothetical protein